MKLSIITVNYRAWRHIQSALESLQPDFPEDWEIIIVDNETDRSELAQYQRLFPWATMIPNPKNSGFGYGCIIGVEHASGEQLLFMNPDVIATVADIRALIAEKAAHPDVAVISPNQVGANGKPQKVFDEFPELLNQSKIIKVLMRVIRPGRKPDPRASYDELVYCDWVTGSFLLIDRTDYEKIGGWCSDYWMYSEDADLCKRADDAGLKTAFTPTVQVIHAHGGSSRINVAVKAMTKLEVIISKHVYAKNHFQGVKRWIVHLLIAAFRLPGLLALSFADLLTFRRIATLNVRSKMLAGLVRYYAGVARTGSWLSPRAKANRPAQA
jgi:GT2 family glycosyltransferase